MKEIWYKIEKKTHFNKYIKISTCQFFLFMVIFILSCMVFYQASNSSLVNLSPGLSTALTTLIQNYH